MEKERKEICQGKDGSEETSLDRTANHAVDNGVCLAESGLGAGEDEGKDGGDGKISRGLEAQPTDDEWVERSEVRHSIKP